MKPRRIAALAALLAIAVVAAACTSKSSSSEGGNNSAPVTLTLWHGYGKVETNNGQVNYEAKSINDLIAKFNAAHKDIQVDPVFIGSNDNALEKLTVALQGGEQPDITYQYGTSLPQIATAPGVMDLTDRVAEPSFQWTDFVEGARAASQVDGRVYGIPALIDNLAIVYNKDLFDAAGLEYPTADWTWDDFRAAAKALTDPSKQQFGFAYPIDGSEDTVWHYDAMLWGAGGDILNSDDTQAAFNSDAGVQALTTLRDMSVTDKSVYLDQKNTGKIDDLFNSGNIGMLITGPWALSAYTDVSYGVQIMPAYSGGTHASIAGPDMWVMFDNGNGRADAAWTFMQWFTAAEQVKADSLVSSHLPIRQSVVDEAGFVQEFDQKFPGEGIFAENLSNVTKARPVLQTYDQISRVMAEAIVRVMLGQDEPKSALDDAAQQTNAILSGEG